MRYAVWFVRLLFASWMIPAGLNHFVPIFPQPMGSTPLSTELVTALIDSHLFDLVKGVELVAGVCILLGWYVPLALVVCMPVSFCVFYYDAPLEGWGSQAALFGYAVLGSNLLLCLAYLKSYRPMLAQRADPTRKQLVLIGRILFGAGMVLNGANYLFLSLWANPTGSEPLAMQLMASLVNSELLNVVMVMQLVAGLVILSGFFVPAALCILMPLSTCALFWTLLDLSPLNIVLALAAFALNGLLMLAYLKCYLGVLEKRPVAFGETSAESMNFDSLFVTFSGRTARELFIPAMITVVAVILFYEYVAGGRTSQFAMVALLFPACVLLARRMQDMGNSGWFAIAPVVLMLATYLIRLEYFSLGEAVDGALPWVAVAVSLAFMVWGAVGQAGGNTGGVPASSTEE